MNQWCAVHTQARAEDKAAFHLRRQGYSVFLPRYLKRRRHARKVDWVPAPLFPRYVFVAIEPAVTRWRAIRSTVGVADLVCFGGRPAAVPPAVIAEIDARQDAHGIVAVNPVDGLKQGDRVQVVAGPLCDVEGLFECAGDDERVTILLELMGRQVRTRVPMEAVAACA
jgi:transcriptional antiterminator RfaH